MVILVNHKLTPTGMGIELMFHTLMAYPNCCLSDLELEEDKSAWTCQCREFTSTEVTWSPTCPLSERMISAVGVNLWLKHWTGLKNIEADIQWE